MESTHRELHTKMHLPQSAPKNYSWFIELNLGFLQKLKVWPDAGRMYSNLDVNDQRLRNLPLNGWHLLTFSLGKKKLTICFSLNEHSALSGGSFHTNNP